MCRGVRRRMILAPVPRERERWYALWLSDPRLDRSGYRRCTGTGPPHHWTVVGRLRRGWAHSLDIRAVRWCPPALEAAQQAALKGAVQELPANSGMELANWNWKVVCQYVLRALRYQPEPQHLPQLSAPAGILLQTPQETACSRLMWRNGRSSWRSKPPLSDEARWSGAKDILR